MCLLGINTVYGFLNNIFTKKIFLEKFTLESAEVMKIYAEKIQPNAEQMAFFQEMIEQSKYIYTNFSSGIWIFSIMLSFLIGFYITTRGNLLYSINKYHVNLYVIYTLIIALIFAIFSKYSIYSWNFIIGVLPLFFMQGIGIITYKFGRYYKKSKLFIFISILCLLINPYIVIFISFIGLFDNWFDFRKFNKLEDINENHSN
jgi:hypothetical protein